MDTALSCWLGLSLLALFLASPAEKRLGVLSARWPVAAWRVATRSLWGGSALLLLTAFSAIGLRLLFPNEPAYLGSGSWITVAPAILWGALIVWVTTGKQEAAASDAPTATMEGRIDAIFNIAAMLTGRTLKCAAWVIAAALALLAIYLFGTWANVTLEQMPRNSAIVLGAVIIAWAVASRR